MLKLKSVPYLGSSGGSCIHDPSSSYSGLKLLHSWAVFPRKPPFDCSSQSRFISAGTHCSVQMAFVKTVDSRGSKFPENIAIRATKENYSYHQLILSAKKISNLLTNTDSKHSNAVGDEKNLHGARVGIVAQPSPEFVAGLLGTWFVGGVAVPLALSYPEMELLHVVNDSDISMILSTEGHHNLMKAVAAKTSARVSLFPPVLKTSITETENEIGAATEIFPELSGNDPALIVYTSGTTGKPKGVVHTHKGILAQTQMLTDAWGYTSDDHFLNCMPLHHVHGLFNALLAPLYAGATVELMPKFSVRGIWQRWRESYQEDSTKADGAITVFTGVPTMYTRLLQGYEAMDEDLKNVSAAAARKLRLMMCGSSALPLPVMKQWEAVTGHVLLERYGMTEFIMAISNPLNGKRKGGTVGKPLPGVQVKILAEDGSGDTNVKIGELCIKSPSLFKEYWNLPEVTKDSLIDDGFFKTGDAVTMDEEGYYVILGRTNADIMKVGGYKLSALEIEAALLEHPTIIECCVLGLPDQDYGDAVCAIVIPDKETKRKQEEESKPALTLEELSAWAKDKLAPYKIPTRLLVWESLPRNAMGKVNKKELKKMLS
ncbi:probable CoA ligase CCL8 [Andrographis paniculata]|uniref:probable CoA ligase CCL8 n=1 Tax=Andrographis paniculata TaxID=175694 RepID=UPI0021E8853A|nr:probable CoA ligase CCL8 [Andrographis paniculata]XP_051136025.1 probable CoA ligase CCL8 [Andrographis paniculata]